MFLHYILSQSEESFLKKFFNAQMENSNKTDWTYQVEKDLKELEICLEIEDIKRMSKNKFKRHINKKIECAALKYLKSMIKTKGKELDYTQLEIQEYLTPEADLKLYEKQDIFKIRSRMVDVKENMKGKHVNFKCEACKKIGKRKTETQEHVYKCKQLNKERNTVSYKQIFGNNIHNIKKVMNRMNENIKTRKNIMKNN